MAKAANKKALDEAFYQLTAALRNEADAAMRQGDDAYLVWFIVQQSMAVDRIQRAIHNRLPETPVY